jgi:hypothetical protein
LECLNPCRHFRFHFLSNRKTFLNPEKLIEIGYVK